MESFTGMMLNHGAASSPAGAEQRRSGRDPPFARAVGRSNAAAGFGFRVGPAFYLLAQGREISVWRPGDWAANGNVPSGFECRKDNRRPADRVACVMKALFAEAELLQDYGVFRQVVLLEIIKQLAAARSHLEEPAAGVEVLAMCAQMLGQVIDPGGQQRDLDLARAGVLLVGFELGDDFGFYDCRHGLVFELHDCRGPLWGPVTPVPLGRDRRHRSNPAGCGTSHGASPQPMDWH